MEFLNQTDYVILNNGNGTRIDVDTGKLTVIDLKLVSAALCNNSDWLVGDSTMGSDHYPHRDVSQRQTQTRNAITCSTMEIMHRRLGPV